MALMEQTVDEQNWAERIGKALRASEQQLGGMSLAQLRAARARAVGAAAERRTALRWAVPAALTAALLAWMLLPRPEPQLPVNVAEGDALEVLTDEMDPEFYRDLDLYLWLEDTGGDRA